MVNKKSNQTLKIDFTNEDSKVLYLRIPKGEKEKYEQVAKANNTSLANVLRTFLSTAYTIYISNLEGPKA